MSINQDLNFHDTDENINANLIKSSTDMGRDAYSHPTESITSSKSRFQKIKDNVMSLSEILSFKVVVIFAILPFVAFGLFYDRTDFIKTLLLSLETFFALFVCGVILMRSKLVKFDIPILVLPLIGFVLTGFINLLFSLNINSSLLGTADNRAGSVFVIFSLLMAFILATNSRPSILNLTAKILKIVLTVAVIFSIIQILNVLGSGLVLGDFITVFGPMNFAGIAACVLMILVHDAFINIKEGSISLYHRIFGVVGFVSSVALVFLLSWWPMSILLIVAFILPVALRREVSIKQPMPLLSLAILVTSLSVSYFTQAPMHIRSDLPIEVMPNLRSMFSMSVESLKLFPMGVGFENFIYGYDYLRPDFVTNSQFHNLRFVNGGSELFTKIIEGGFPALIAIVFAIIIIAKNFISNLKFGLSEIEYTGWSIVITLLVASIFYPFNIFNIVILVFGLALVSGKNTWKVLNISLEGYNKSFLSSILGVILCIASIFGIYVSVNVARANYLLAKAVDSKNPEVAVENIVTSIGLNPSDDRSYRALAESLLYAISRDIKAGPVQGESQADFTNRIKTEVGSLTSVVQKLVEVQPNDAQNWFVMGYVYQNLAEIIPGADQLAVEAYSRALKLNPGSPVTYYRIGNTMLEAAERNIVVLNKKDLKKEAIDQINNAVKDNFRIAEENYKKAISLYNNFGDAIYNLSATYERQGKLKEAISSFEVIVKSDPGNPANWLQLGLLYYRNNQKEAALSSWSRAVEISPTYSNARWYLSLILEERGRLDEALAQVLEIEKFNKDEPLVKKRLEQLNAGRRIIPPGNLLDQKPL